MRLDYQSPDVYYTPFSGDTTEINDILSRDDEYSAKYISSVFKALLYSLI